MSFKKIKKGLKKLLFDKFFKIIFMYTKYYEKKKVNNNKILFQSFDGSSISGNVYYMLLEICSDKYYDKLKKYVVANSEQYSNIKDFLKNKIKNQKVKVVKLNSRQYCKLLATAKYLINNSTFPAHFIKKEGQIYINTWHGTPLKNMGRNIKNSPNELGNTQRNFIMSDYLLYQNEFMFNKMREDYMLNNLYKGKYLISGYPRNDIFYNEESRENIKETLKINDKKILVYMPTWRGALINKKNLVQYHYIMYVLLELDRQLENDTILYVKLHNYVNIMMNFKVFKHIRPFPEEYETYEFLNIADALITDYSSVFFDYANTKKKIILFAHDKEEYLSTRGMYLNYEELPFNILTDIKDLLKEIKNINEYSEYKKFNDEFCNYDSKNTTKQVCDYIFKGIKSKHIKVVEGRKFSNNKDNVLLFDGDLAKNGITTALKGLYKNIDLTKRNYFLTFYKTYVVRNKQQINFFENIDYIPIQGICNVTAFECFINYLYKHYDINNKFINKIIDNIYKREAKRVYPNIEFKYVMHFTGYESKETYMFNNMNSKKIIFVHNDMQKEEKNKRVNKKLLIQAYKRYDKIALIRKELLSTIKKYLRKEDENKICVVHNLNNIETILENKNKEIVFDKETYSNIELNELKKILNDKNSNKFIDIARFSEQKGLDRLVIAFDKFQNKNPNNYLIIIGGYGNQFNKINNLIKELNNKNIILIKSLNNPYSILNKSNCFVLSSYYEGLPMTVMEALILGVKVISTDIEGPREFLSQGYGHLVDNSLEGLIEGFNDYINGKLDSLKKFDYQEFNKNALEEFESLFD